MCVVYSCMLKFVQRNVPKGVRRKRREKKKTWNPSYCYLYGALNPTFFNNAIILIDSSVK